MSCSSLVDCCHLFCLAGFSYKLYKVMFLYVISLWLKDVDCRIFFLVILILFFWGGRLQNLR